MDLLQTPYLFIILILIITKDVMSLTLSVPNTDITAVYGNNSFLLECTYNMDSNNHQLFTIELKRKRSGDATFIPIVTFQNPESSLNVTYSDDSLKSRTEAKDPTNLSLMASLKFKSVACNDEAKYQWDALWSDGTVKHAIRNVSVVVKTLTTFKSDGQVSRQPSGDIVEGDIVTFTCTGDVGKEPSGQLGWYLYYNTSISDANSGIEVTENATATAPEETANICSYSRTSTLSLKMMRTENNLVVRCTVQQDTFNEFGNGYKQIQIGVKYAPLSLTLDKTPEEKERVGDMFIYYVGTEALTMTCDTDSNPAPTYYWLNPENNQTKGNQLELYNLTEEHSGNYTCFGYNTIDQVNNNTISKTVNISVRIAPTTTTTTTTTSTSTVSTTGGGGSGGKLGNLTASDDDNTTTTIVVVVVVIAVLIIIAVIVAIIVVKKRKNREPIEEPPEKPRNNQDLSFYGNRPDLVSADHGMKNNVGAHNTSFNNSFDSTSDIKSRNDDGLHYVDLQFDDKPRSRRPIQLLDNGNGSNTSYSDITMPRV